MHSFDSCQLRHPDSSWQLEHPNVSWQLWQSHDSWQVRHPNVSWFLRYPDDSWLRTRRPDDSLQGTQKTPDSLLGTQLVPYDDSTTMNFELWTFPVFQEAQAYAEENSLLFMETSAKTAMNVNDIFLAIGEISLDSTPLHSHSIPSAHVSCGLIPAKKLPKNEQGGQQPARPRGVDLSQDNQQSGVGCCKWSGDVFVLKRPYHTHSFQNKRQ